MKPVSHIIRAFSDDDADALVALWGRCGLIRPQNDPRRDIARNLAASSAWSFVAEAEGAIVGGVLVGYDGHRGWVNYLAVDPSARRRGVGAALMARAEATLREVGCPKINLQVRAGNETAIAFYRALGFGVDEVVSLGKRLVVDRVT